VRVKNHTKNVGKSDTTVRTPYYKETGVLDGFSLPVTTAKHGRTHDCEG